MVANSKRVNQRNDDFVRHFDYSLVECSWNDSRSVEFGTNYDWPGFEYSSAKDPDQELVSKMVAVVVVNLNAMEDQIGGSFVHHCSNFVDYYCMEYQMLGLYHCYWADLVAMAVGQMDLVLAIDRHLDYVHHLWLVAEHFLRNALDTRVRIDVCFQCWMWHVYRYCCDKLQSLVLWSCVVLLIELVVVQWVEHKMFVSIPAHRPLHFLPDWSVMVLKLKIKIISMLLNYYTIYINSMHK